MLNIDTTYFGLMSGRNNLGAFGLRIGRSSAPNFYIDFFGPMLGSHETSTGVFIRLGRFAGYIFFHAPITFRRHF